LGAAREGLTLDDMKSFPVPLPSLDEQRVIADFLDAMDERVNRFIDARRRMMVLLEEQNQATIAQAVTKGLDPAVPMKPSGVDWLGDIPAHWEVRRLKSLYREFDERSESGEEEQLSVSHLTGVTPRSEKTVTMFEAESYEGHKLCRPGDLVVNTMWAWMGALGVSDRLGLVSPSYAVYRKRQSGAVDSAYFHTLLRTRVYVDEYNRRSTGIHSSRLRLYPDQFLNILVPVPPTEEQSAIVREVSRLGHESDSTAQRYQREIELIQEYRTRLISDVVTGKLAVTQVE
jgi:type I restriction enzyme S subunit